MSDKLVFSNHKFASAPLLTFIGWALLVSLSVFAALGHEKVPPTPLPFDLKEQLVYEGEFSRLMLRGINVVELKFSADRAPLQPEIVPTATPNALLIAEVNSKGWFSKLFGLRFRYRVESTVEAKSFAVLRTNKLDEQGERVRTSDAVFNREENKITWTERDPRTPEREPRVVVADLDGTLHDIVSVFYYLRRQELQLGQSFELQLSDSGAVYQVPARVVERKRLKTLLGEVQAVRVEVEVFGRLVNEKGEFSVWFTDDARHIPVRAQINSNIGTLEIKLKSVSG